jgi:hypothetical protein
VRSLLAWPPHNENANIMSHAFGSTFSASLVSRALIDMHELCLHRKVERRRLASTSPGPLSSATLLPVGLCCSTL